MGQLVLFLAAILNQEAPPLGIFVAQVLLFPLWTPLILLLRWRLHGTTPRFALPISLLILIPYVPHTLMIPAWYAFWGLYLLIVPVICLILILKRSTHVPSRLERIGCVAFYCLMPLTYVALHYAPDHWHQYTGWIS